MILLLDNYDSFSFILKDYLQQCHEEVIVRENTDAIDDIVGLEFTHVVLSPGPKTPQESGCLMHMVAYCATNKIPTMGVCLGHQAIGSYFGGTLVKAEQPMHGKVSLIKHTQHLLFKEIPASFNVCRYHSLVITEIENTPLNCIAESKNHEIMALSHKTLPMWGVQFHPEAILTQYGLPLLKNWLSYCHL